jgi:hypothetical protein
MSNVRRHEHNGNHEINHPLRFDSFSGIDPLVGLRWVGLRLNAVAEWRRDLRHIDPGWVRLSYHRNDLHRAHPVRAFTVRHDDDSVVQHQPGGRNHVSLCRADHRPGQHGNRYRHRYHQHDQRNHRVREVDEGASFSKRSVSHCHSRQFHQPSCPWPRLDTDNITHVERHLALPARMSLHKIAANADVMDTNAAAHSERGAWKPHPQR